MIIKSKNKQVQQFLDELREFDAEKYKILQKLRGIVFSQFPKVNERIMYDGVMFSIDEDFGGLFVSKDHISFEFGDGYKMKDPKKLLDGTGKHRRHLKIKSLADIENKGVAFFVKQVI